MTVAAGAGVAPVAVGAGIEAVPVGAGVIDHNWEVCSYLPLLIDWK